MADDTPSTSQSAKKRTRGASRLAKWQKKVPPQGGWPVEFDPVTGKVQGEHADEFITYTGWLVKSKISILVENWKSVTEEDKNMIWQDLCVCI